MKYYSQMSYKNRLWFNRAASILRRLVYKIETGLATIQDCRAVCAEARFCMDVITEDRKNFDALGFVVKDGIEGRRWYSSICADWDILRSTIDAVVETGNYATDGALIRDAYNGARELLACFKSADYYYTPMTEKERRDLLNK